MLVFSAVVSCVHVLFDVLAIKNDISFWASRSSFAGLSASNVATSLVLRSVVRVKVPYLAPFPLSLSHLVLRTSQVTTYLWFNEASLLVVWPAVASLGVQAWKVRLTASRVSAL